MARPPRSASGDSRRRIFAAAAAEFAARGYAGANVDRIARAAGLNKAMIYYHFKSKAALYRAILRDMFAAVGTRVAAVAAASSSPEDKVRAFVDAIAAEAQARPHFPPIWLREIAEGGEHVDTVTLNYVRAVPEVGGRLVTLEAVEGQRVAAGDVVGRLDTADTELAVRRASAERAQAQAQLALLQAGSRAEDIRQASAQLQSARSEVKGAQ